MTLIDVMSQMDLIDIYGVFYPKTKEYTFFSAPHRIFSKTDHIVGHKTNLNRYKKSEITLASYDITMNKGWTSTTTETTENPHTRGN